MPKRTDGEISIVPANEATWEDIQAVLGTRGDPHRCPCQRYKMQPGESWASFGVDELAFRLRAQTDCGRADSATTSGIVAYLDDEPVGWCARRAANGVPAPAPQDARPVGGAYRGQDRCERLVGDVASSHALASAAAGSAARSQRRPSTSRDGAARALEGPTLRRVVMRIDF